MGEKDETKNEGEKSVAGGGDKAAQAKDDGPVAVVLKLDLHCEGCAKKVRRSVSHLEGVEKVKADWTAKKLTVTGNVDPILLREKVEIKTKKKVELISPPPKKDGGAAAAAGGDKKAEEKPEKKTEEKKADENKKPKEAAINTVVMKTKLHCDGCANKIKRIILKNFEGVESVTTDLDKDLITVIGTMDVDGLLAYLEEKLRRGIEILSPKKEKEKEMKEREGDGGEKKEKTAATTGGDKKVGSKLEGSDGEKSKGGGEGTKIEVNKMEHHSYNTQTHYAVPTTMYNQSYGAPMYHQDYSNMVQYMPGPPAPPPTYLNMDDQMFSDENPNGCSVM